MATLTSLLKELENKIEFKDSKNPQISQSDVAWHIAHSLKVLCNILKALQVSNPEEYRWKFNRTRSVVYFMNRIPRGKAKAPKVALPEDNISEHQLQDELKIVRQLVFELDSLDAKSNFTHPIFGQLNLKQTKKFLALHTNHHLKIIDDIIRS